MTAMESPMATKVSPLAPARFPDMPAVEGVRLATPAAGLRYAGRNDRARDRVAPARRVGPLAPPRPRQPLRRPHRRPAHRAGAGHGGRRRPDPLQMPVRAG